MGDLDEREYYNYKETSSSRKENFLKELEKERYKECTFKPRLNKSISQKSFKGDIYQRAQIQLLSKREREESTKKKLLYQELSKCTFHPKTNKNDMGWTEKVSQFQNSQQENSQNQYSIKTTKFEKPKQKNQKENKNVNQLNELNVYQQQNQTYEKELKQEIDSYQKQIKVVEQDRHSRNYSANNLVSVHKEYQNLASVNNKEYQNLASVNNKEYQNLDDSELFVYQPYVDKNVNIQNQKDILNYQQQQPKQQNYQNFLPKRGKNKAVIAQKTQFLLNNSYQNALSEIMEQKQIEEQQYIQEDYQTMQTQESTQYDTLEQNENDLFQLQDNNQQLNSQKD